MGKAIMPVYNDVLPVIMKIIKNPDLMALIKKGNAPVDLIIEIMDAGVSALSKLSEDDLTKIVERSLPAIQIRNGQAGWSDIMLPTGQLMYTTLKLPEILRLVWAAVEVNLGGFFADSLGISQGKPQA